MTLGNRYNKIMEKVNVTPEMEARVLRNLARMDLGAANKPANRRKKALSFPKIISLAACLVLLVAGALTLRGMLARQPEGPPPMQVGSPTRYATPEALCEAAGFDLLVPAELPAGMQAEACSLLGNGVAEIVYSDGTDALTYRMAAGTEDISGDYTEYPVVDTADVAGRAVTMKGGAEGYYVATWTDGEYAYAVSCTRPMTREELAGMVAFLEPCGQGG